MALDNKFSARTAACRGVGEGVFVCVCGFSKERSGVVEKQCWNDESLLFFSFCFVLFGLVLLYFTFPVLVSLFNLFMSVGHLLIFLSFVHLLFPLTPMYMVFWGWLLIHYAQ